MKSFTIANRPKESYGMNIQSNDGILWEITTARGTMRFQANVNNNGTLGNRAFDKGKSISFSSTNVTA